MNATVRSHEVPVGLSVDLNSLDSRPSLQPKLQLIELGLANH